MKIPILTSVYKGLRNLYDDPRSNVSESLCFRECLSELQTSNLVLSNLSLIENDATFLMDNVERNETYTTFKLFSHRSWKLSAPPDTQAPLFFRDHTDNTTTPSGTSELLVVAQPCPENDRVKQPGMNNTLQ